MRKILLVVFLFGCLNQLLAQSTSSQELFNIIRTSKNDSLQIDAALTIIFRNQAADADTLMYYAKKLLSYGQQYKYPHIETIGYIVVGYAFYRLGDLPKLQEYTLKAGAIADKHPDSVVSSLVNNCISFYQTTPDLQIAYMRKALQLYTSSRKPDAVYIAYYGNLTGDFMDNNQYDSALLYAQKAYEYASDLHDPYFTLSATSILGDVHLGLKHYGLALAFYKEALGIAEKTKLPVDLKTVYSALTNYYDALNQQDSAVVYATKMMYVPGNGEYDATVSAAGWLYKYYQGKKMADSTIKYMGLFIDGQDSVYKSNNLLEVQKVNFEEELRQRDIETAKEAAAETRHHNIQLAILAIGIFTAAIIFLVLSRSIVVSHKLIEILGVIVLLVVFEFINLILHPFLETVTKDSPALMLLALVVIAALIVPMHHRLEHWVNHKLVEKNKAIKLAKAKRVIEEFEEKKEAQS